MAISNCPRCGAQTNDENDLCYQCALRRIDTTFEHERNLIDEYEELYAAHFGFVYPMPQPEPLRCDYCNAPLDSLFADCPNCDAGGLG